MPIMKTLVLVLLLAPMAVTRAAVKFHGMECREDLAGGARKIGKGSRRATRRTACDSGHESNMRICGTPFRKEASIGGSSSHHPRGDAYLENFARAPRRIFDLSDGMQKFRRRVWRFLVVHDRRWKRYRTARINPSRRWRRCSNRHIGRQAGWADISPTRRSRKRNNGRPRVSVARHSRNNPRRTNKRRSASSPACAGRSADR